MAKEQKIRITDEEANVLSQVLDMIVRKFRYDNSSERFVCNPGSDIMSLEFDGYAHLNSLRSRMQQAAMEGGRR